MLEQHFNKALSDQNAKLEAMQADTPPIVNECNVISTQHEIGILFLICVLVQFPSFQKMLSQRIPSMYNDNALSVIGVVFNGLIISILFILAKRVVQKHFKEL